MNITEVFRRITTGLEQSGIPYMLTGSFASTQYGAPRSTQDIDIVISATPAQLRSFVQTLRKEEYYAELDAALEAHRHESLFNIIDLTTAWKIDLIFRKSRPFSREEFDRRRKIKFHGLDLFVATPEDIIIAKLEWAKVAESKRQIDDVAAVLKLNREGLDYSYLEKWISQLELREQWNAAKGAVESDRTGPKSSPL